MSHHRRMFSDKLRYVFWGKTKFRKISKYVTSATKHKINSIIAKKEKTYDKENQDFGSQLIWQKLTKINKDMSPIELPSKQAIPKFG